MAPPSSNAAPAKVNLGLRITARRADGYHELESLFAPLDLADDVELEAEAAPGRRVRLELRGAAQGIPSDGRNLAVRAAQGFLEAAALEAEVRIRLTKQTPAAAGLGGGSSDAAAVLRALAARFPDALAADALAKLALGLGADVPFFLDPRPTLVRGIGERLEPVAGLPALALVLVNPGVALSTAEVYAAYDALQPKPSGGGLPDPRPILADPGGAGEALAALLANDLEGAAVRLCPAIGRLREHLRALGALGVALSGSGATVFGVFEDAGRARAAATAPGWPRHAWVRVAATLESR